MRQIKTERYKGSVLLWVALFVMAAAMVVVLIFWQVRIADKTETLTQLQEEVTLQDVKNAEIQKSVDALESEDGLQDYAEEKARREMDYAKPGERVFVDVGGES